MEATLQRELARLLAQLRRDGRQQSGLDPRLVPPDKATAYRIAGMVAEELGWPVLGWKIAAAKEEMQKALRIDSPIYGRTFFLREAPATFVHARMVSPIPEVEYQAKLGADLPPRDRLYTIEEVTEAVASLHPGIEMAECRFVHDAAFPPLPASPEFWSADGRRVPVRAVRGVPGDSRHPAGVYRIVTSVPPRPSNSVRATPFPGRNAGGCTEPVST